MSLADRNKRIIELEAELVKLRKANTAHLLDEKVKKIETSLQTKLEIIARTLNVRRVGHLFDLNRYPDMEWVRAICVDGLYVFVEADMRLHAETVTDVQVWVHGRDTHHNVYLVKP